MRDVSQKMDFYVNDVLKSDRVQSLKTFFMTFNKYIILQSYKYIITTCWEMIF